MPPDPYERLQAARTAVKALQHERVTLAVRLAELARSGDEDDLVAASTRLDTLPGDLLRAELRLARADHQAAQATLLAAEASLTALVEDPGSRDTGARDAAATAPRGTQPDGSAKAPTGGQADRPEEDEEQPGDPDEGGAEADAAELGAEARGAEADPGEGGGEGPDGADAADAPAAVGARRVADEQWVRDCRLAAERAERRARELQTAVDRAPTGPADEAAHRGFAKRVAEARDTIEGAGTASNQAELDLIQATELARVALEGLAVAGAGADWRALEHARQARTAAAGAVGPAWEASRWAGLRVARAEYELDRLVEERLAGQPSEGPNGSTRGLP